ncbi:hypothetical protein EIP91_007575 [Steccherinum ochraceum]|uniref:Uncharacterized protein n=1 Tax=Steccherinum ochraceum TaxID=92696 RepID=A0A4R0RUL8_9APHY|nr:hypothetical protein EIP91_007575 [Steccherinum ochraceum]
MAIESVNVPATPAQGGLDVPTTKTRKRALTVTAPTPADLKKTKVEPPPVATPDIQDALTTPIQPTESSKPILEDTPTSAPTKTTTPSASNEDEEEPWWKSCREEKTFRLPGQGPHTFLTGSECLSCLFNYEGQNFMVLKSAMLEVAVNAKQLKEDHDEWELGALMEDIVFWELLREEVDEEPEEVNALAAMFKEADSGDKFTYEVTVQREKPAEGLPAMEFKWTVEFPWLHIAEEDQGIWWMTAISAPDKESLEAARILWKCLPQFISP